MTRLLEKAIAKLAKLPEAQQESMAQWILVGSSLRRVAAAAGKIGVKSA